MHINQSLPQGLDVDPNSHHTVNDKDKEDPFRPSAANTSEHISSLSSMNNKKKKETFEDFLGHRMGKFSKEKQTFEKYGQANKSIY